MLKGDILGEGTYGIVYSCNNIETGDKYAVKRNLAEKSTLFLYSVREMDMLIKLRDHPNIIRLECISYKNPFTVGDFEPLDTKSRRNQRDDNLHFLFSEASCNLYEFMCEKKNDPDYELTKRYMIQILLSVEYMHKHSIIHCDLKPSNILIMKDKKDVLGNKNIIQICDFGLSIPYTYQGKQTSDVVTSWYRAPEIILGYPHYDFKIDIWSIACIFYEMITNMPFLVKTPENDNALMSKILASLPEQIEIKTMRSLVTSNKWKKIKLYEYHKPKGRRKSWIEQFGLSKKLVSDFEMNAGGIDLFSDLLTQMFQFDWNSRYDITECIEHPFFNDQRLLIDETRKLYQPNKSFEKMLYITPCQERIWVKEIAFSFFKNNKEYYRSLFQALHLFDSYIDGMYEDKDIKIPIFTKYETLLKFYTLLYLFIKYFSVLNYSILFNNIFTSEYRTSEAKLEIEKFETSIIQKMEHDIYRVSIYEAADNFIIPMDDNHVFKLLESYFNVAEKLIVTPSDFVKSTFQLK